MRFVEAYEQGIVQIITLAGGQDKPVHIFAGLFIWIGTAAIARVGLRSPWALAPVFVLEGANEVVDRIAAGSWRWPDTVGDIFATLFWPCFLSWSMNRMRSLRS